CRPCVPTLRYTHRWQYRIFHWQASTTATGRQKRRSIVTDQIRIFDTTLRDGEQAPGCSMTMREKLRIAKALSDLRVDVIEAGFPAASPGDFEAVQAVAEQGLKPIICGLARCNPEDIEKVFAAVKGAKRHRIHVFVATSEIHREHKLHMAKEEVIRRAVGAISMARELCDDV